MCWNGGIFKKIRRDREEAGLSLVRHEHIYQAIKEEHEAHNYPITELCKLGRVSRAAYYKWLNREIPENEKENQRIAEVIESIHKESPDKGYRRIRDDLERYHDIDVNEKWLTDVTEFKYYVGPVVHKIYLSAILDLYDRRIVSFVVRDSNNNALVFDTFDEAIEKNPNAHPLCHSDRGYQYTNRLFHSKLEKAGMTQSMSRVGKCIDNGPMEGFWGILKRERYYGKRFTDKVIKSIP